MKIKTTEAAILVASNSDLILDEIQFPEKLSSGQVLVELITSGICGAQINEIDAVKGPDRFLPHLLGHEGYARVLEVGDSVSTVKEGDEVVMHWRPGSGAESKPPSYTWRDKPLNAGWVTTFNRHAIVSENRLTQIDANDVNPNLIPLLGCALTTALGVLENEAKVNFRDHLLIFGAGGVGLTLLKVAKFMNVSKVTIVDINQERLAVARALGADRAILFESKEQVLSQIFAHKDWGLPNVAIDTSGNVSAIEICYESTQPEARIVLVGVPRFGETVKIYTLPLHFGKSMIGSKGGGSIPNTDIPALLGLLKAKRIDFSDFPTKSFEFQEINNALTSLREGLVGRAILKF
ncbi:AdhC Zn-dependent alcohol dehydrogenases, class III [Candidatus Nanopelagicaceae bacterium]